MTSRSLRSRAVGSLARRGVRRGLDGSSAWMIVGVVASVLQLVDRVARDTDVVETIRLRPGEAIEIRTRPPGPRS